MNTNIIEAYQVAPEYQETPFNNDEFYNEKISFLGNKNYYEHLASEHEKIIEIVRQNEISDMIHEFSNGEKHFYKNYTEIFLDYFRDYKKINKRQVSQLLKIFDVYNNSDMYTEDELNAIADILTVLTKNKHDTKCIKGCCQGDWQYIIYDTTYWNDEQINDVECVYYNLGTEWKIVDNEEEFFSYYCENDIDAIRQFIASETVTDIENVKMFKFDGFSKIANYKEV